MLTIQEIVFEFETHNSLYLVRSFSNLNWTKYWMTSWSQWPAQLQTCLNVSILEFKTIFDNVNKQLLSAWPIPTFIRFFNSSVPSLKRCKLDKARIDFFRLTATTKPTRPGSSLPSCPATFTSGKSFCSTLSWARETKCAEQCRLELWSNV